VLSSVRDIAMSHSRTPSLLSHVATRWVQSACRSTGHVLVRLSRAPPTGGAHAAMDVAQLDVYLTELALWWAKNSKIKGTSTHTMTQRLTRAVEDELYASKLHTCDHDFIRGNAEWPRLRTWTDPHALHTWYPGTVWLYSMLLLLLAWSEGSLHSGTNTTGVVGADDCSHARAIGKTPTATYSSHPQCLPGLCRPSRRSSASKLQRCDTISLPHTAMKFGEQHA
jgi:hypothetical protein